MKPSILATLLVGLGFLTGSATVARGQPAANPTSVEIRTLVANGYAEAGMFAQNHGEPLLAAGLFEKAYGIVPHPLLLLDQAHAYRLAGNRAAAVYFYQRFLVESPTGNDAAEARHWLAQMGAPEVADPDAAPPPEARPESRLVEPGVMTDVVPAPPPAASAAIGRVDRGRMLRSGGLVSGGLGLVALGAGLYFASEAGGISDELSEHNHPYDPDAVARGERAERNMTISYVAGAALISAGVAAYVIGRARRDEPTLAVGVQGDGAIVGVQGTWP